VPRNRAIDSLNRPTASGSTLIWNRRGGEVGIADPGQRLGHGGVRRQDHRLGGHQTARGVRRVAEQPSDRLGLLGVHATQEELRLGRVQHAQQVGGVVGVHGLEHVGGPLGVQLHQQDGLVVLGQLLQDVGHPLVVEGVDDFGAALGRQVA